MMKKLLIPMLILTGSFTIINTSIQSCTTIASSPIGLSIIKNVLLGGIDKAVGIYSNKEAFLQNNMIEKALPQKLKEVNKVLQSISPNLVTKEKEYIAEAASFTINTSAPILRDAVNSLDTNDVTRIIQGEKGVATQILREKTYNQLISTITPKVDTKLNEYGIIKSINKALQGSNILGSILGSQNTNSLGSNELSQFASEQLVNGLFYVVEDYEIQNANKIYSVLGAK